MTGRHKAGHPPLPPSPAPKKITRARSLANWVHRLLGSEGLEGLRAFQGLWGLEGSQGLKGFSGALKLRGFKGLELRVGRLQGLRASWASCRALSIHCEPFLGTLTKRGPLITTICLRTLPPPPPPKKKKAYITLIKAEYVVFLSCWGGSSENSR